MGRGARAVQVSAKESRLVSWFSFRMFFPCSAGLPGIPAAFPSAFSILLVHLPPQKKGGFEGPKLNTEGYRSGHNENDSKSFDRC